MFRKKRKGELPLTAGEQAFASTLSSVYKVSLKELRIRALKRIQGTLTDLEKGAVKAKLDGRDDEFERIKDTMKETVIMMKGVRR